MRVGYTPTHVKLFRQGHERTAPCFLTCRCMSACYRFSPLNVFEQVPDPSAFPATFQVCSQQLTMTPHFRYEANPPEVHQRGLRRHPFINSNTGWELHLFERHRSNFDFSYRDAQAPWCPQFSPPCHGTASEPAQRTSARLAGQPFVTR